MPRELFSTRTLSSVLAVLSMPFAGLGGCAAPAPPQKSETSVPPGYTVSRTGNVHDFDYFAGGWTTLQRRLKQRGVASTEWEEFPATLCMALYLDGMATVDELYFPTKGWAGLTLRTFDLEKNQWSIYWVSSASGKLETPVVGGFDADHGAFYGEDQDNNRPVKVRYTWDKRDRDHARWEQHSRTTTVPGRPIGPQTSYVPTRLRPARLDAQGADRHTRAATPVAAD